MKVCVCGHQKLCVCCDEGSSAHSDTPDATRNLPIPPPSSCRQLISTMIEGIQVVCIYCLILYEDYDAVLFLFLRVFCQKFVYLTSSMPLPRCAASTSLSHLVAIRLRLSPVLRGHTAQPRPPRQALSAGMSAPPPTAVARACRP